MFARNLQQQTRQISCARMSITIPLLMGPHSRTASSVSKRATQQVARRTMSRGFSVSHQESILSNYTIFVSNTAADNLRYASAVCLYDFPKHKENSTSSCDLEYACSPLQEALESGNLDPSNETEFGYCQADNNAFYGTAINDCVSCLQSSSSSYMANCK